MTELAGKSGRIKVATAITITAATHSGGIVTVTAVAHGLSAGMFVLISGVTGMTDLNNDGKGYIVLTAADADTFTVSKTTAQTYTSDGSAQRIIPITGWNASKQHPVADTPHSESGAWMTRIFAGFKTFEGSYESIFFDKQDLTLVFGNELTCEFDIDDNQYYSGSFLFEGQDLGVDLAGASGVAVSGTFKNNGTVTFTPNT